MPRGGSRNNRTRSSERTSPQAKFERARRDRSKSVVDPDDEHVDAAPPGAADRRNARREELLDAALIAIRRLGPSASMNELAAEAGVTKPILYRHFGDRDGLVAALAARFTADLMGELQAALAQSADTTADPRSTVESTVDAFVRFLESDPDVYRLLVHRAVREQPGAAEALGGFLRQVGQAIALVLGEQLRAVGADSGGAEVLAHGIVGLVHSAGDWWLENPTMPRARLVAYVTDLLWGGLSSMGLGAAANRSEETTT
ncbi:MAG TPA: TetR/AcrR family transcriptional regulator [Acidimicrobiales bacterium]|nr:TetR/AcrR family transcriptional regulator [Acidimicrobiales bacterium]